jgi:hypothetical protein
MRREQIAHPSSSRPVGKKPTDAEGKTADVKTETETKPEEREKRELGEFKGSVFVEFAEMADLEGILKKELTFEGDKVVMMSK